MSRDGWVALPCGAMGLSSVCDCGISWSYSLTIFYYSDNRTYPGYITCPISHGDIWWCGCYGNTHTTLRNSKCHIHGVSDCENSFAGAYLGFTIYTDRGCKKKCETGLLKKTINSIRVMFKYERNKLHKYYDKMLYVSIGLYATFKLVPDIKKNTIYLSSYIPLDESHSSTQCFEQFTVI